VIVGDAHYLFFPLGRMKNSFSFITLIKQEKEVKEKLFGWMLNGYRKLNK
jgi:hypothetical protein